MRTNKKLGELWNQKRFDGTWRELLSPQELKRLKEAKHIGRKQKFVDDTDRENRFFFFIGF